MESHTHTCTWTDENLIDSLYIDCTRDVRDSLFNTVYLSEELAQMIRLKSLMLFLQSRKPLSFHRLQTKHHISPLCSHRFGLRALYTFLRTHWTPNEERKPKCGVRYMDYNMRTRSEQNAKCCEFRTKSQAVYRCRAVRVCECVRRCFVIVCGCVHKNIVASHAIRNPWRFYHCCTWVCWWNILRPRKERAHLLRVRL